MTVKIREHARLGRRTSLSWLLLLREKFSEFINLTGLLGQGLAFMLSYEGLTMAMVTVTSIFLVSREVTNVGEAGGVSAQTLPPALHCMSLSGLEHVHNAFGPSSHTAFGPSLH